MAEWWWWWPLPAWLGSGATWFVVLNAVVAAIAILSRARPPLASPRRRGGVTRRASSAAAQRLRSFSIFSFPSACFRTASFLNPDAAAAAVSQETEKPVASPTKSPSRALALASPHTAQRATAAAAEEEEEDDPNAMSMEEAYSLALEGWRRPEPEKEKEARRSEVDAKAEEFIRGFKDELRQQRLNSIFNYTQMLKRRAAAAGRGQEAARPDQL